MAVQTGSNRPGGRARTTFVAVWAAALTLLLGLPFTGMTARTLSLWATDPAYTQTSPVVDLGSFALGGILITVGPGEPATVASAE